MFINIGIRKAQNAYDSLFWFGYETFIYLFEFKVFRRKERETQFLSMLTFPSDPTTCGTFCRPQLVLPRWDQNSTTFLKTRISTTVFFQISKILSPSRHDVIHIPCPIFYLGILLWHLWLSYPPHMHVNTCAQCVHLTNPCTKRKVLSLTKLKGKIYKMKSLRNYITPIAKKISRLYFS